MVHPTVSLMPASMPPPRDCAGRGRRALRIVALLLGALVASAGDASAFTAKLRWQDVPGVGGYRLYVWANGVLRTNGLDVGLPPRDASGVVTYQLANVNPAQSLAFAVTSYAGRAQSPPSNKLTVLYSVLAMAIDSDADGLTDGFEDKDLDLFVDPDETDPRKADTDGDGIRDGTEVANRTNPRDPNDPKRATPVPTRTPVRTATPVRTKTPTPTRTPVRTRTATPVRTATAVRTPTRVPPTATPVRTGTAVRTATPGVPTPRPTPGAPSEHRVDLPLGDWAVVHGTGTLGALVDPELGGPVLRTTTTDAPSTLFTIANPPAGGLACTRPILGFGVRDDDEFHVEAVVRETGGRTRVLTYVPYDGLPTIRGRHVRFPIGSDARSRTIAWRRVDLARDLKAAFQSELATLEQVRVSGDLTLAGAWTEPASDAVVRLDGVPGAGGAAGARPDVRNGREPAPPAPRTVLDPRVGVPVADWDATGPGVLAQGDWDATTGVETLRGSPATNEPGRFWARYPRKVHGRLIAPYRSLSLLVRDARAFVVEVTVGRDGERPYVLRYQQGVRRATVYKHQATLPLAMRAAPGMPYALVDLDLAADLATVAPGGTVTGVLAIRVGGRFRATGFELADPVF